MHQDGRSWKGERERERGEGKEETDGGRASAGAASNDVFLHNIRELLKCSLTSHAFNSYILSAEWRREGNTKKNDHHNHHREVRAGLFSMFQFIINLNSHMSETCSWNLNSNV